MTFQKTQIEPPMLNDVPAAFLRDQKEKGLCLCWLDQRTTRAAQAWIKKAWAEFRKEIISNSHPPIGGIFCYDCCECRGDYAKNDGTGAMVERLLLLLRLRLCTDPAFCGTGRLAEDSAAGLLCGPRDSCDTGVGTVTLPIADGVAGFLLCRSEEAVETGEACVPVCGIGFSTLPLCARIGGVLLCGTDGFPAIPDRGEAGEAG